MDNIKGVSLIKMDFEETGLNVMSQWLALMLCIWNVLGSNFGPWTS
jgi:hypothetical protein